jgi:16S rRNA (guanine527-N7)-methyltransferase
MAGQQSHQQRLADAAQALGIEMDAARASALLAYMAQLERWNRTYNLTAVRDPDQMLVQHLFDSLSVLGPMEQALQGVLPRVQATIVDVGSGGGLPGVVLAIMRPQWQVYCVDAVEKKMAFVRQMSRVLTLPNLQAVHARVETLDPFNADIVVSRAFASLLDFATLAGVHVAQGGHLLGMKGREPEEEIGALQAGAGWNVERIEPLTVPELDARRCLVWMSRSQGNL